MTHSALTRMVKLALLNIVCLIFLTLEGESQIGCGMTIDASITPNPKCGVLPTCDCDCDGQINTLEVQYIGPDGVDINVWNKPNHQTLITSFSNVQNGDLLSVSAIGVLPGDDFETNTMFEILGGDEIGISTSCNTDVAGATIGDFLVFGFTDTSGNTCDSQTCREACECSGKLTELWLKYTGPSGVDINIWDEESQDVLLASVSNAQTGVIIYLNGDLLPGNDLETETWCEIVGEGMVSIMTDCSIDVQGKYSGEFQVVGFVDGSNNTCGSFGTGEIDLTVTGNGPFTYDWSDQTTSEDVTNAVDGVYSVTITDDNGCSVAQTYQVGFSQFNLLTEGLIADSMECTLVVPKVCSCPCTGSMNALTLYYDGNTGNDINVWNNAAHDVLIASFSAVETGTVISFSAVGVAPGDIFETTTYVEVVGESEEAISTDCAIAIAGTLYGDFQVYGHEDSTGGVCEASDCIPPCGCQGKVQNFTMQYIGIGGADINIYGDAGYTILVESFDNVQYGDIMFVEAVGSLANDGFGPTTYIEINGVMYDLHTSCSIDALGELLGDVVRIIHFTDGQDEVCNDLACSSVIDIDVLDGLGPYAYVWSNGATTQDLVNVCPGNYSVTIYDANACTHIDAFELGCYCDGNDGPACAQTISSENISCILGGNFEEPTLQCNPIAGSLDGSTPSPEAYSDAATGEDRWYMFTAVFPGVSIYVESDDFDIVLELQDRYGNLVDIEDKVSGLGAELLNIGSLVEGESYLLGVRASDGFSNAGDFSVCITELPDSRCDRFGPFDLCHIFKADWVCADDYLFHFTNLETGELTTHQSGYPYTFVQWIEIPIYNWGSEFQIEAFPIYHIEDGAGNLEYITIDNNEPCVVETVPMPTAELDLSDRCETLGPQFMGGYIAASPWICSASDWTWEFQRVDQGELPIIHSRGVANRFMQISDVPGLQHGATYNVRVKPEFVTGEPTSYGGFQCLQIIGGVGVPFHTAEDYTLNFETDVKTAVQEGFMAAVPETPDFQMLLDEYHARQLAAYPNPTVNGDFTLDIAGMNEAQGMLEILDVSGKLVYQENLTLTGERQLISMSIGEYLAPGMYEIALRTGSGISTTSLVVGK